MAEKLTEFEFPALGLRYPWDDWMDGGIWKLTRGTDFNCQIASLVAQAHSQAGQRGGAVRTHTEGTSLILQFQEKEETDLSPDEFPESTPPRFVCAAERLEQAYNHERGFEAPARF